MQKNALFSLHELHIITVLLLIFGSYISWSTRFISLKPCVAFSIFDSVSFLLKLIFLFNKMHQHFDFKTLQFLSKPTHSFAPRPLIFKSQQEVLKFKGIYVSWSSPKAGQETIFLKFWECQFFSIVTFKNTRKAFNDFRNKQQKCMK